MSQLSRISGQPSEMAAAALEDLSGQSFNSMYYVVTDDDRISTNFLFTGRYRRSIQHVAEVQAEDLRPEDFRRLALQLFGNVQTHPAIPTEHEAVWVDPVLVDRAHYERVND